MNKSVKSEHLGRKITRLRELKGIDQEVLAIGLGVNQDAISELEESETIDELNLKKMAKILGMSSEGIKKFSEVATINYFSNFYDTSSSQGNNFGNYGNTTFHPLDKLVGTFDKLVAAAEENKRLYERLLQSEKEKNAYLEKLADIR